MGVFTFLLRDIAIIASKTYQEPLERPEPPEPPKLFPETSHRLPREPQVGGEVGWGGEVGIRPRGGG